MELPKGLKLYSIRFNDDEASWIVVAEDAEEAFDLWFGDRDQACRDVMRQTADDLGKTRRELTDVRELSKDGNNSYVLS